MPKHCLSIAVVAYRASLTELTTTLKTLDTSLTDTSRQYSLTIVDNTPIDEVSICSDAFLQNNVPHHKSVYIRNQNNVGFGAAHNQCLNVDSEYHLIFNPDIELSPDALTNALAFMDAHPECGLLTPRAYWQNGQQQYLCKRMPTVFNLLLRGFAPKCIKRLFAKRLAHYEMTDVINETDVYWNPPIVSGCFMLFRTSVWKQLNGFDDRFFLYFEDFDLSLRAGKITQIAYVPSVKIIHHGGHAARKGWNHIKMFSKSMCTFFNIHGWRLF